MWRINQLLCLILPVLIVSLASGAPTDVTAIARSRYNHAPAASVTDSVNIIEAVTDPVLSDYPLAAVAEDFAGPPAGSTTLPTPVSAKALPAVPGTLLMVLAGFFCISLVRDRNAWMTGLAAVLWAGQIGIQALPQIACRFARGSENQKLHAAATYTIHAQGSRRRSDIEGTQYIGLLHHLAGIPELKHSPVITPSPVAILPASDFLIASQPCTALQAEQIICFSPAFIFDNLARGPPESFQGSFEACQTWL